MNMTLCPVIKKINSAKSEHSMVLSDIEAVGSSDADFETH